MRKTVLRSVAATALILLFGLNASAACPNIYGDPYCDWRRCWYHYDLAECYTVSGSVTRVTMACGSPGFDFGSGTGQAQAHFTLTSSIPILNASKWNIGGNIHVNSPGGTSADRLEIDINVYHPNTNSWSYYTNYFWSGLNGNYGCLLTNSFFTANTGDTIYVYITATNSGSATIQASELTLTNDSN